MIAISFDGFDWDQHNRKKCLRHGVSREEIEALLNSGPAIAPDTRHSLSEERFIAVGRNTGGRAMFVAFTVRSLGGRLLLRPISARYMHAKEMARYEKNTSF